MTIADLQVALGNCKPRNVYSRMRALDMLVTCTRCGGSGHYSFNHIDGTMCYGCNGHTVTVPKRITRKLIAAVIVKVEAGELKSYFEANRAAAAFKREIKPLKTEIDETWKHGEVHTDYESLCEGGWGFDAPLTQDRAGAINKLWGAANHLEKSRGSYESTVDALKIILTAMTDMNMDQANDKQAKREVGLVLMKRAAA